MVSADHSERIQGGAASGIRTASEPIRAVFRISRFDMVTSFFMALILFIGTFVLLLFIIWLTNRWTFPPKAITPTIQNPAGRGDNAPGFERDFEPPGAEEVEDLLEPTLQDTIEAITDVVSPVAASVTSADTQETSTSIGAGAGDSRPPGPEGEGAVPPFDRWQLNFSSRDLLGYATQLDFYSIELGAIGGNIQGVDVASNLSTNPTSRRITDTQNETRLYFIWTVENQLMKYDQQLLRQANVTLTGRQILKFIPGELEKTLVQIELEHAINAGHESIDEVAKTVFESTATDNGFAFEVSSQRYR